MPDYKKMYLMLFNAVTDALTALASNRYADAKNLLMRVQAACEEVYIETSGEQD